VRAEGVGIDGHALAVGVIGWRSLNPHVAAIDSMGVLTPVASGPVTVVASAGGWRTVAQQFEVRVARPHALAATDWSQGLDDRWRPYGTPQPSVVRERDGTFTLGNNGDDNFYSGVVSVPAYPVREGLTLRTTLMNPVTMGQWQEQSVSLLSADAYRTVPEANWRLGDLATAGETTCGVAYPGGEEGITWGDSVVVWGGAMTAHVRAPAAWKRGTPFTVRVDILPDGRCAIELGSQLRWLSEPVAFTDSVRVQLGGHSVGSRVRVGPVRLDAGNANR
jgi:hypothetical protein